MVASSKSKPDIVRIESSTPHYETFNTKPPTSRGKPPTRDSTSSQPDSSDRPYTSSSRRHETSPLPTRQLIVLAVIALAEQTAFNSISPYLPAMVASFPGVSETQVGTYVGLVATSFALAQFLTNFCWGWVSDRVGRKPVIMIGTILTAACFVGFGFSRTFAQAVIAQALMGLVNGNQGVVSTCLGEITDRSNQSRAFTYLPVVYGLGGIIGPIVGGSLAETVDSTGADAPKYPFLLPNLVSAGCLVAELVVTALFLEESLEDAQELPSIGARVANLFVWVWQFTGGGKDFKNRHPRRSPGLPRHHSHTESTGNMPSTIYESEDESDAESSNSVPVVIPHQETGLHASDIFNRDVVLVLATFLIFQFSNIAYNSLYPIFAQANPPIGRNLTPEEIGITLAFAGVVTIVFQVGVFGYLQHKMGNISTYRISLAGFAVSFLLMPWIGYKDNGPMGMSSGQAWLWIELGAVLIIKTVAAVGGLTSALLLITNSAPDHSVLGRLNGIAQTLSAGGRAIGPFVSGSLFSLSIKVRPKGEAIPFGVFGGVAFLGFLLSFGIGGGKLAGEQLGGNDGNDSEDENEGEGDEESPPVTERDERTPLMDSRK